MKKIILLACVAAIACGDDDITPMADAGMMDVGNDVPTLPDAGPDSGTPDTGTPDTGVPDTGPPPVDNICDPSVLENVTADVAMVVSTTIDTSAADTTPAALESCGDEPTGQIVVAITIPGAAANQIVQVSTANEGTEDFDTILDLRTECGTEGVCFDDIEGSLLSRGTIIADGGSTIFALVSGYGGDDVGVVEVTTEILGTAGSLGDDCDETLVCVDGLICNDTDVCEMAEPPVFTAAEVVRYDNVGEDDDQTELLMGLTGMDPNGDVVSFDFTFLDADDAPFDFFGDGDPPTFTFGLEDAADLTSFTVATPIGANATADYPAGAVRFRLILNDSAGLQSEEIIGDIITRAYSGAGESCAFTSLCDPAMELVCGITEECETPVAPVLTAATSVRYDNVPDGGDMLTVFGLGMTGTDANGDAAGFNITFLDAADEVVEVIADNPTATFLFDEITGLTSFMDGALIVVGETSMIPAEVVRFRISLLDASALESNEITGDITGGTVSAVGATCGFTELCDPAAMLTCNVNVCEAAPAP